ncbi:MAG: tRNA preQ1(34) S-adenosylmethionine ribosyltransferase-isomerase QueA, partial [Kosmotoga sp.]
MKTPVDKFNFHLPEKNIAQYPSDKRDESRLLIYDRESGEIKDRIFKDILSEITGNDFLVINNTKVLKARLLGRKKTGGKTEILVLNIISPTECEAITKGNIKKGDEIFLENSSAEVLDTDISGRRRLLFSDNIYRIMEHEGHVPLPPYIKREDEKMDEKRYQTVYSTNPGSIAAPTAGLHFTNELMKKIKHKGVEILEITLNVGIGTFRPIKSKYVEDHQMHEEYFHIPENAYERINRLKKEGKNLIAVGTTTLRALESASHNGQLIKYGELST